MYYVTMTDKFMSGWGLAEGKINKLIIECQTWQQAQEIENHAKTRDEMKHINIALKKPYYNSNRYYLSNKKYEDMSGWHKK